MRRTGGANYMTCTQTTVGQLPLNEVRRGIYGARGGKISVAERASLNAIKLRLLVLLDGNGVSVAWVTEHTGVGRVQCSRYLEEIGAKKGHGNLWRKPSPKRLRNFGKYY